MKVLVLAGTKDAGEIAVKLKSEDIEVIASVTTDYGRHLLSHIGGVCIHVGKLDKDGMIKLVREKEVMCIVDASHPYASQASENAIKASDECSIPYIRFERMEVGVCMDEAIRVKSFEEAAKRASSISGNIFLTVGSNNIHVFTKNIPDYKSRLYARVLPDSKVLLKCEEAGLMPDNIIALKGPFSKDMNVAMLKHCNASILVTKESGEAGGTLEKLEAAIELGVKVIIVDRPNVAYGTKVSEVNEVVEFLKRLRGV
ncbi:precorrin-6A reductase [Pseudobacteroides cellulosolvens]|uniref:Precorrin-6x reductase n=1 Tax=Pseudobacteroides cellulosolvens ATCC 35603 = DSM 2933 TaxID=398512 RepID=A0A0L6JQ87_9FIRM|nr:precorrin-6A reductase [Pseudobacteroides cellulosolvens]KNY28006.1 precorrin-6x reductase [Pseudobacteroides cellulosolvens ATCC 35603 = DSM 2933]